MQKDKNPEVLIGKVSLDDTKALVVLVHYAEKVKSGWAIDWLYDLLFADGPDGIDRDKCPDTLWEDASRIGRMIIVYNSENGELMRLSIDKPGMVSYCRVRHLTKKDMVALNSESFFTAKDTASFFDILKTVVPCDAIGVPLSISSLAGWT